LKAAKNDEEGPNYTGENSNMKQLFEYIGTQPLLSTDEVKELAERVQLFQSFSMKKEELTRQLRRAPSCNEWAAACGRAPEEVKEVVKTGLKAKQKMVHANYRLVVSIAQRYTNKVVGLDDLIAEGILGLIRGVEKYDPSKGFKFSTYAHWWIRQAIIRSANDHTRVIRVPTHLHELSWRAKKKQEEVQRTEGRKLSNRELAEALSVPERRLERMWEAMKYPVSLDAPSSTEGNVSRLEYVEAANSREPDDQAISLSMKTHLESVLETLTKRERTVIRERYGLNDGVWKTLEQVGIIFNITKERVRQIESNAIRKLRHPARSTMLLEYAIDNPRTSRRSASSLLRKS